MRDESRRWLLLAKEDLKSAEINHSQKVYYVASFMAQQSSEKALKGLLIEKEKKLLKIHDLVLLAKKVHLPPELIAKCDELTRAYVATRYPDNANGIERESFDEKTSEQCITIAEEILQWVGRNM